MLVAVDAGTTSVRALAIDATGRVLDVAARPLRLSLPAPGLVEQDASELLSLVDETLAELIGRVGARDCEAVGITNQRETVVAIDRDDGRPLAPAIVWQDRRTAAECAELASSPAAADIRARTGLPCDPYFSGTKLRWLLEHAPLDRASSLGLCTVDTLVCWHLTGGAHGGAWVTDHSNASRTMLYDLAGAGWSTELCERFGVPTSALARVVPSSGVLGAVASDAVGDLRGVPVAGLLGDQQAALLGQGCVRPGMGKATFGTGAFLLVHAGTQRPADLDGIVTTVAWDLGAAGARTFAFEGAAFVAGAAIQWLADDLGLFDGPAELAARADAVTDASGACFVPALAGLGSPWWDAGARGALVGLAAGVGRDQVARSLVESLAFQGRAMLDAIRAGTPIDELRVDGGAASSDLLCRLLASGSRCRVVRPPSVEATARGAAFAAGLAIGTLSIDQVHDAFVAEASFPPEEDAAGDLAYATWLDAVRRTRELAREVAS